MTNTRLHTSRAVGLCLCGLFAVLLPVGLRAQMTASPVSPLDPHPDDQFGFSVAVEHPYCIVGAPERNRYGDDPTAAYIFIREGSNWVQQVKLSNPTNDLNSRFGYAVAISSHTAVIGDPHYTDNGVQTGRAYVYERDETNWTQTAVLSPAGLSASDRFCFAVDLDGAGAARPRAAAVELFHLPVVDGEPGLFQHVT